MGAAAASAISFTAERIFVQVDQNNTMGWAGTDVGAWIQAAYNSLPATGGTIYVAPKEDGSAYAWTSAVNFGTNNKIVTIEGAGPATCLKWMPMAGVAITCNWGDQHIPSPLLKNLQLTGPGAATATTAVLIASSRLTDQASIEGMFITDFGVGINTGPGDGVVGYDLTFSHMGIYTNGVGVLIPANSIPVRIIQCEISQNTIAGISVTGSAALWSKPAKCADIVARRTARFATGYDQNQVDEMVPALLALTMSKEGAGWSGVEGAQLGRAGPATREGLRIPGARQNRCS